MTVIKISDGNNGKTYWVKLHCGSPGPDGLGSPSWTKLRVPVAMPMKPLDPPLMWHDIKKTETITHISLWTEKNEGLYIAGVALTHLLYVGPGDTIQLNSISFIVNPVGISTEPINIAAYDMYGVPKNAVGMWHEADMSSSHTDLYVQDMGSGSTWSTVVSGSGSVTYSIAPAPPFDDQYAKLSDLQKASLTFEPSDMTIGHISTLLNMPLKGFTDASKKATKSLKGLSNKLLIDSPADSIDVELELNGVPLGKLEPGASMFSKKDLNAAQAAAENAFAADAVKKVAAKKTAGKAVKAPPAKKTAAKKAPAKKSIANLKKTAVKKTPLQHYKPQYGPDAEWTASTTDLPF